jgi:hypothetical protein
VAGPGIESLRSDYRRSATSLHPRFRPSSDSRSCPDECVTVLPAGDEFGHQLVLPSDLGGTSRAGEDIEDDLGLELRREGPSEAPGHWKTLLDDQYRLWYRSHPRGRASRSSRPVRFTGRTSTDSRVARVGSTDASGKSLRGSMPSVRLSPATRERLPSLVRYQAHNEVVLRSGRGKAGQERNRGPRALSRTA